MGKRSWKIRTAVAAGILTGAFWSGPAMGQVTVLSETWEGGSVGVINPLGGTLSLGNSFMGDNTWTVVVPTQDAGTGPHMQHEILEFNGSRWLGWQADGTENAIDTQSYYGVPVNESFLLGEAESVSFSFDIVPKVLSTGGRRSATFHIGADVNNSYRFQINLRESASELIAVASIVGGVALEFEYGAPENFDDIVVDGVYTFSAVITPSASETTVAMEFRNGSNVIESGMATFSSSEMLPLSTEVDYFALRARQRTYQLWDNLLLEYTPVMSGGGGMPQIMANGSVFTEGDVVVLTAPAGGTGYQWMMNGGALSDGPRISGATSQVLTINPAVIGDTGEYTVQYDDGSKAIVTSAPFFLTVLAAGALPLMGGLGLGILVAMLVSSVMIYLRRRQEG